MERLELNERQLGHRLGVTQQAIGKRLKQGFPRALQVFLSFSRNYNQKVLRIVNLGLQYQQPNG